MVLPSYHPTHPTTGPSSPPSSSLDIKKDQLRIQHKCTLWLRHYRSLSPLYRFGGLGGGIFLLWLTICILWRRIALDYELRQGASLFQSLYPSTATATIPILIPVYSRPEYLQRVLSSLRNTHNINQSVLVFSQDGSLPEITNLIHRIDFAPVIHLHHSPPYFNLPSYFLRTDAPTAANVYFLLQFAFEYNKHIPAAIILESDIELSVDGYDYFRWAYDQVAQNTAFISRVLTINGYYEPSMGTHNPYQFTIDEYGFMVWGWLCPSWSYPIIREGWTWFHNWDITIEENIRKPNQKVSLSPLVSRTKNIGMKGINFNIQDPQEISKWENLYISKVPIPYDNQQLQIITRKKEESNEEEGKG